MENTAPRSHDAHVGLRLLWAAALLSVLISASLWLGANAVEAASWVGERVASTVQTFAEMAPRAALR